MSSGEKKAATDYKDIPLFVILIPIINALNYYLTYSSIHFNTHTLLTFTIDTVQGYVAWWIIRSVIRQLDRRLLYSPSPLRRIGVQLLLTTAAALAVIIITTEIINRIAKDTPVPASFYRFDIFIFIIWFLVVNGIYIGLHYYIQWNESEKLRDEEKKIRLEGFSVKKGKQSLNILFPDIAGIYVQGDYAVLITMDNNKYLLDQSLDKVEKSLPSELFFRLNRKYILNRRMITGYERSENAKINIMLADSGNFPGLVQMSRIKAPAFKTWYQAHE
jgi:DNA-binding LytR/AlgR family response regulator